MLSFKIPKKILLTLILDLMFGLKLHQWSTQLLLLNRKKNLNLILTMCTNQETFLSTRTVTSKVSMLDKLKILTVTNMVYLVDQQPAEEETGEMM